MVRLSRFPPAPLEVMSWHVPDGSPAVSLVQASRGTPGAERRGSGQQFEAALPVLGTEALRDKAGDIASSGPWTNLTDHGGLDLMWRGARS
jgi:hypothetical protein